MITEKQQKNLIDSRDIRRQYIKRLPKYKRSYDNLKSSYHITYQALHQWIRYWYIPPKHCEICDYQSKWIDLANITGVPSRNIDHWLYLCRSCHKLYDKSEEHASNKSHNFPLNFINEMIGDELLG
jgi:uncharacterized protein YlaI